MKILGTGMELTIIKWTFGLVFGSVVIILGGKIIVLLVLAAKLKIAALQAWLASGTAMHDTVSILWKAIWEGK